MCTRATVFYYNFFFCAIIYFRNSVVTNYIYYFHHRLQLVISKINHLVYKHQKIVKNAHHNFFFEARGDVIKLLYQRIPYIKLVNSNGKIKFSVA